MYAFKIRQRLKEEKQRLYCTSSTILNKKIDILTWLGTNLKYHCITRENEQRPIRHIFNERILVLDVKIAELCKFWCYFYFSRLNALLYVKYMNVYHKISNILLLCSKKWQISWRNKHIHCILFFYFISLTEFNKIIHVEWKIK